MTPRIASAAVLALVTSACSGWYNPLAGVRGLFAIALLVIQLIIAFDVIQSGRSTGLKVLWIAFVFLVPIIGVLAYLIFERK